MPSVNKASAASLSSPDTSLKHGAVYILLLLVALDILLSAIYLYSLEHGSDLVTLTFNLNTEKNIPSTYSTIKLILAGLVAMACISVDEGLRSSARVTHRDFWLMVGTLLVLLAIDEYFAYHEGLGQVFYRLGILAPEAETIGGYLWPWTVYGALFTVAVGIPAAHYSWKIFSRYRYLFYLLVLAGCIYIGGALGFENYGAYLDSFRGGEGENTAVLYEELSEMLGISLVIFVFLRYRGERQIENAREDGNKAPAPRA